MDYWVLQVEMGLRFLDSNFWKNEILFPQSVIRPIASNLFFLGQLCQIGSTCWQENCFFWNLRSHLGRKTSFCCYYSKGVSARPCAVPRLPRTVQGPARPSWIYPSKAFPGTRCASAWRQQHPHHWALHIYLHCSQHEGTPQFGQRQNPKWHFAASPVFLFHQSCSNEFRRKRGWLIRFLQQYCFSPDSSYTGSYFQKSVVPWLGAMLGWLVLCSGAAAGWYGTCCHVCWKTKNHLNMIICDVGSMLAQFPTFISFSDLSAPARLSALAHAASNESSAARPSAPDFVWPKFGLWTLGIFLKKRRLRFWMSRSKWHLQNEVFIATCFRFCMMNSSILSQMGQSAVKFSKLARNEATLTIWATNAGHQKRIAATWDATSPSLPWDLAYHALWKPIREFKVAHVAHSF